MTTQLDVLDPNSLRKSRRNSMIIMRAASQMNLNEVEDNEKNLANMLTNIGPHGHGAHKEHSHEPANGNDAMVMCVTALYGKLLVILGMAFPIAKSISKNVPLIVFNSFYLYLYFGSITFILYSYLCLLHERPLPWAGIKERFREIKLFLQPYKPRLSDFPLLEQMRSLLPQRQYNYDAEGSDKSEKDSLSDDEKDLESNATDEMNRTKRSRFVFSEASHGSMYLKVGTVVFGIGSMIYSGLEFGKYFEFRSDCSKFITAVTPIAAMVFTFLQMYYIFLYSRVSISRHSTIARFGLMHMLATNLCVWINVLVYETEHTMHILDHEADQGNDHGHNTDGKHHYNTNDHHNTPYGVTSDYHSGHNGHAMETTTAHYLANTAAAIIENITNSDIVHNLVKRGAGSEEEDCPRIINVLGELVDSATPFLFPCTIEYSLLCGGVIYVMWKNVITLPKNKKKEDQDSELSHMIAHKLRHHYSVDCARASRGLFMGIFLLVLTIITLILFFVLISSDEKNLKEMAIRQANISEITIYSITIIASLIGMKHMRELSYHSHGEVELDNVLLLIAQAGVYIFNSFTIIGGYFNMENINPLSLLTSLFALTQATLQSMLILQGSQRACSTSDQLDRKPGREVVTFMLVANLSMWAISTFQTSRAQLHPAQLEFYGKWAWTIISHVSMPLAIFYRFHATVCLGEIWKKSYKMRVD